MTRIFRVSADLLDHQHFLGFSPMQSTLGGPVTSAGRPWPAPILGRRLAIARTLRTRPRALDPLLNAIVSSRPSAMAWNAHEHGELISFCHDLTAAPNVYTSVAPARLVVVIRIVRKGSKTMEGSLI
jgi:hypothetical protein